MRICDRCHSSAVDEISFTRDDESFDVCESCRQEIRDTLTTPKKEKRGRKKTRGVAKKTKEEIA